jgi:hypothetical protein
MGHSVYLRVKPFNQDTAYRLNLQGVDVDVSEGGYGVYMIDTYWNWPWDVVDTIIHSGLEFREQKEAFFSYLKQETDEHKKYILETEFVPWLEESDEYEVSFDWD